MYFYECRNKETSRHKPDGGCTLLWDDGSYCKYSKSATFLCFRSLPLQWTRPPQQPFSVEPHLCGVWPIFCKLALYVQIKKKKLTVCLYFSQLSYGAQKEQSLGTYLAWNASGGRVTLSARFLHLVCRSRSLRADWLYRRGLRGHCVCTERCAGWITFPGNSCQIHQSRAEDRKAGRKIDRGGWQREWAWLDCLPTSNAGLKGFWWVATPSLLTGVSGPRQLIV